MKYKTMDGQIVEGATANEVVEALRAMTEPTDTLDQYMAMTAMRVRRMTGESINSETVDEFLKSLVKLDILKPVLEAAPTAPPKGQPMAEGGHA